VEPCYRRVKCVFACRYTVELGWLINVLSSERVKKSRPGSQTFHPKFSLKFVKLKTVKTRRRGAEPPRAETRVTCFIVDVVSRRKARGFVF